MKSLRKIYAVTCGCGYRLLLPKESMDTVEECPNCFAELPVNSGTVEYLAPEPVVEAPAPAAPSPFSFEELEVRDSAPEMEPESTVEEPVDTSAFAPQQTARSPFEDDAPDEDSIGPKPLASASPFEEDEEEEKVIERAAPIAGKGEASKNLFYESFRGGEETEHEVEKRDEAIRAGNACPECGTLYKGDWDKIRTADGMLCYVCSNQASEGVPERIKAEGGMGHKAYNEARLDVKARHVEVPPPRFWLFDTQSEGFRRMLYVMAFGLILAAWYASNMPDAGPVPSRGGAAVDASAAEAKIVLTGWAKAVYWGYQLVTGFATTFLALYIVLYVTDRLPHETFGPNFIVIGTTTLVLALVTGGSFYVMFTLDDPMFGVFVRMMMFPVMGFSQIWILMQWLDFRIRDFVYLYILTALAQTIVQILGMFFRAGLYTLIA